MIELIVLIILYGTVPLLLVVSLGEKVLGKLHLILPFIILTFLASCYEFVFTYLLQISSKYFFVVYNVLAFMTLSYFYRKELGVPYRKYFLVGNMLFILVLFFVLYNWSTYEIMVLSSYLDVYQTLFVLFFSIIWFHEVFTKLKYENLLESINFFFISGIVLYYCGTVLLFLLSDLIYKDDKSLFFYFWLVNIFLTFILRTLLIVCIWKARVK